MLLEVINTVAQHQPVAADPTYYAASFEHAAGAVELVAEKFAFTVATLAVAYRVVATDVGAIFRKEKEKGRTKDR